MENIFYLPSITLEGFVRQTCLWIIKKLCPEHDQRHDSV